MTAKLSRLLVKSNKLRTAYVRSGAVIIETNDAQRIKITDIKTAYPHSVTFILYRIIISVLYSKLLQTIHQWTLYHIQF